ncbi:ESPR-type extended signal peptide-containing protein, partial [Paraburkholderia humisilvae]
MNRNLYRLIWSRRVGACIPVAETATRVRGGGRRSCAKLRTEPHSLTKIAIALSAITLAAASDVVWADSGFKCTANDGEPPGYVDSVYGLGAIVPTDDCDETAYGASASAGATHATAYGRAATANGAFSIAIGFETTASADSSLALGSGAVASVANSIALGTSSIAATAAVPWTGDTIAGTAYTYAGSASGVVS